MIQNTMNKDPASEASEENLQSETLVRQSLVCVTNIDTVSFFRKRFGLLVSRSHLMKRS